MHPSALLEVATINDGCFVNQLSLPKIRELLSADTVSRAAAIPTPQTKTPHVLVHVGRLATVKSEGTDVLNMDSKLAQRNLLDDDIVVPTAAEQKWLDQSIARGRISRSTETILVTPGLAKAMLVYNISNRHLTETKIARHAARLSRGAFILTHQGIAFAKVGILNDGQHRLTAIIRTGIAAYIQVTFGAEREEFEVIDSDGARTTADLLSIQQYKNGVLRASIASVLLQVTTKEAVRADQQTVAHYAVSLCGDDMDEAIRYAQLLRKVCAPTVGGVAYWWIKTKTRRAPAVVPSFFDGLDTGEGLVNPKLRLREWLKDRTNIEQKGTTTVQRVAVIVHAYNAFCSRKKTFETRWPHVKILPDVL